MEILNYGGSNYESLVKGGMVLVDFYAEWCGPCKMLSPILNSFASDRNDVKVLKVDIDSNEALAGELGVMSVPTLILYKDGHIVSTKQGFQTVSMLNEWIDSEK